MNNDLQELKSKLKLPPVSQIGVIVKDMRATVEYYSRQFGIGPFNVYESSPDHYWFKNKPSYVKLRQGKAMLGDIELELIQPLEGESPYHEFLENEGEGLNHLGFNVPNYDEMYESFINAGIKQLMRVESYVKNYDGYIKACNFDTRQIGGVVIEIIWKSWLMSAEHP